MIKAKLELANERHITGLNETQIIRVACQEKSSQTILSNKGCKV